MLEKMGRDTESDACCATGDDVHLAEQVSPGLWQSEWKVALGC